MTGKGCTGLDMSKFACRGCKVLKILEMAVNGWHRGAVAVNGWNVRTLLEMAGIS